MINNTYLPDTLSMDPRPLLLIPPSRPTIHRPRHCHRDAAAAYGQTQGPSGSSAQSPATSRERQAVGRPASRSLQRHAGSAQA